MPSDLDELERLEKAATPDWCSGCPEEGRLFAASLGGEIATFHSSWAIPQYQAEANARLAIASRNALPRLLRIARAAKEAVLLLEDLRRQTLDWPMSARIEDTIDRLRAALAGEDTDAQI